MVLPCLVWKKGTRNSLLCHCLFGVSSISGHPHHQNLYPVLNMGRIPVDLPMKDMTCPFPSGVQTAAFGQPISIVVRQGMGPTDVFLRHFEDIQDQFQVSQIFPHKESLIGTARTTSRRSCGNWVSSPAPGAGTAAHAARLKARRGSLDTPGPSLFLIWLCSTIL